jgi:predicted nucleotidyltransferase
MNCAWISKTVCDNLPPVADQQHNKDAPLTRESILVALHTLSDLLGNRGITGELCLFGGTVMTLAFRARLATKDVDAVFEPAQTIRELAKRVAEQLHLPVDWLNDGVKGYVSARHETTTGNLPQFSSLRLTMPVPEYLLAMKCMAARIGGANDESSDVADIIFLIRHLKLESAKEVLELVGQYYPANRITVKTQYLVEGLFDEARI